MTVWVSRGTLFVGCMAACALLAMPARAATQSRIEPSLTLSGGYDDNVLFDNSGGDAIGRAMVRLNARAWERHWNAFGDARLMTSTFLERGRTLVLGEVLGGGSVQFGRHLSGGVQTRVRTADDPLGLAQFGVLGVEGRTLTYKGVAQLGYEINPRHEVSLEAAFQGVNFFDQAYANEGGASVGLTAIVTRLQTRAVALRLGLESRVFVGADFATAVGLVPGVRWRLSRRTFLDVASGALAFTDDGGTHPVWIARVRLEREWRRLGFAIAAANDLTVPSGRFGVLEGQLAEGVARWGTRRVEARARAGVYRSHSTLHAGEWVPGWGAEAEAFVLLGGPVWLGASVMRFERMATSVESAISRDAVYLRVDITGGRP